MTEKEYQAIYYERTDINEFLCEHQMVKELYDATVSILSKNDSETKDTLYIFNHAYFFCSLAINLKYDEPKIKLVANSEMVKTDMVFAITKSLLRIHQEIVDFDPGIITFLNGLIKNREDYSILSPIVRQYSGILEKPLNFSGKSVSVPADLAKAINYDTISEYACGLSDAKEASVISTMLCKLALDHNVYNDDLKKKIKEIDEVHKKRSQPINIYNNKDSQVFTGEIRDSIFGPQ